MEKKAPKKKVSVGSTKALSHAHFKAEVDIIKTVDKQIRELSEANKGRRAELKEFMVKEKLDHLMGNEYKAVLQESNATNIKSAKALFADVGLERFLEITKVSVEQARKHLTQQEMDKHFVRVPEEPTLKIM